MTFSDPFRCTAAEIERLALDGRVLADDRGDEKGTTTCNEMTLLSTMPHSSRSQRVPIPKPAAKQTWNGLTWKGLGRRRSFVSLSDGTLVFVDLFDLCAM